MVVGPSIAVLVVFILLMVYLGFMFVLPILELAINGIILYVLFLRGQVEVWKEGKYGYYLAGAIISMIAYLFLGNFLKPLLVWGVTTFLIITFIFAQVGMIVHKPHKMNKNLKEEV